jgi:Putative DNA-binding domain
MKSQPRRSLRRPTVPSLAETQSRMRGAVVDGEIAAIAPLLVGGRDPARRLAIHARHYQASLVAAIRTKFPAAAWLLGTAVLREAAQEFVRQHPPAGPCIAEYGEQFPRFLSRHVGAARVPYLYSFAELEWHLGQVAIAIHRPVATPDAFSALEIDTLMDTGLALQGGLHYLHAAWPVDELMKLYLTDTAPSEYRLASEDIWLEVHGARGEFHFRRLDAAEFVFGKAILEGKSIGNAAEQALEVDAGCDIGRAFTTLIDSGYVIEAAPPERRGEE